MRKIMFTAGVIFCTAAAMAQPGSSPQPDVAFKEAGIAMAYKDYTQLKDALVASDADAAKAAAGKLRSSLASMKAIAPEAVSKAIAEATKISKAATMQEIRKSFASLSAGMKEIVKGEQLAKGTIYVEYCPMANNNTGAYWLSNQKEIRNPYFGDKMLKCGSVKEIIQ